MGLVFVHSAYALAISISCIASSNATLYDDIDYTQLQLALDGELPTGFQTTIDQTEVSVAPDTETPIYLANQALSTFSVTQIIDRSGTNSTIFSGHANSVAQRLGGSGNSSLLPELALIDAYEALDWLNSVLRYRSILAPLLDTGTFGNHSWVTQANDDDTNIDLLRRMDWLVEQDDYFHAVGASSVSSAIFAYAMNVVVVKNSSTTNIMSTNALDNTYAAQRAAIHLVVPQASPSNSTPVVSSAAALLQSLARPDGLLPITIKAILMAGAERETDNTQNGNLDNYGNQPSNNGLDYRYGAGQLNVLNNYYILSAGPQQSTEQQGGNISTDGYDYVENFGASSEIRSYRFEDDG